MDLWIRSQDRDKLRKVKSFYVEKYPSSNNRYAIYDICHDDLDDCDIPLGAYETRERALEVLGEIHNHLEKLFWFNPEVEEDRRLNQLIKSYVYNMPKE